jgi:hypothetical protein
MCPPPPRIMCCQGFERKRSWRNLNNSCIPACACRADQNHEMLCHYGPFGAWDLKPGPLGWHSFMDDVGPVWRRSNRWSALTRFFTAGKIQWSASSPGRFTPGTHWIGNLTVPFMDTNRVGVFRCQQLILSGLCLCYSLDNITFLDNASTVEPGYNDIGLCDISPIASDILWYQLIPYC